MTRSRLVRAGALAAVASLVAASALAAGSAAASASTSATRGSVMLSGSVPRWVATARNLGAADRRGRVDFDVLLPLRDRTALTALVRRTSTPGGRDYGRWLTPAQFDARFAPAAASVRTVQQWLRSQGFTIAQTLSNGLYVEATGSVAQAEHAFGVSIHAYRYEGRTLRSPATNLRVPAAIAADVDGVVGLDDSLLARPALPGPPPGIRLGVQPCSAYYGQKVATTMPKAYGKHQPYAVCGYTGVQFRDAYGLGPAVAHGTDGTGVTVAITDAYAAPTILADTNTYSSLHGIPPFAPGQFTQVTPSSYNDIKACGPQGWYGEETLDVQAVHGVAPGANVVFVAAKNCDIGLNNAWAQTIAQHRADVITNSWTDDFPDYQTATSQLRFFDTFALEAAATGITVLFSSGDNGPHTGPGPHTVGVAPPISDPYITAVGGTSIGIGRHDNRVWEYGWENAYVALKNGAWKPVPPGPYNSGSGGGTSRVYPQPWYQVGKVPTTISERYSSTPFRADPDVATPGDPTTGLLVGETQQFPDGTYFDQYRIGGTSVSSPVMAGVMAIVDQAIGRPAGFINPVLYSMIGTNGVNDISAPATPVAEVRTDYKNFVDARRGYLFRLRTIDVQTTILHSRPGYDDQTGVGSPDGLHFIDAFANA